MVTTMGSFSGQVSLVFCAGLTLCYCTGSQGNRDRVRHTFMTNRPVIFVLPER